MLYVLKKSCTVFLALLLALFCAVPAFAADLHFGEDGKFRVLLIADPQDDETPEPDMAPLIEAAIRKSSPDLIIVLGDMVEDHDVNSYIDSDGKRVALSYAETLENCRAALRSVYAPIIRSSVPYTTVLGNNDYLSGVTAQDWFKLLQEQDGILLPETIADPDGRIDNMLPVYGADGKELLRLFTLDTGKKGVTSEQIRAFGKANDQRSIPAVVFQHIPVSEAGWFWQYCFPWDDGAIARGRFFRLKLNTRVARGDDHGELWDNNISLQFLNWKACGNVIGAYFGHTHNFSVEGTWCGIRMGFVYSDRWNGGYQHGAMLLTFDKDDVRNYETTVYRYTGSVTTGDASLDVETYPDPPHYTPLEWFLHERQLFRNYIAQKFFSK